MFLFRLPVPAMGKPHIGTDELLLFPCIPALDQLDRLAQVVRN